jgi:hypothetical protein
LCLRVRVRLGMLGRCVLSLPRLRVLLWVVRVAALHVVVALKRLRLPLLGCSSVCRSIGLPLLLLLVLHLLLLQGVRARPVRHGRLAGVDLRRSAVGCNGRVVVAGRLHRLSPWVGLVLLLLSLLLLLRGLPALLLLLLLLQLLLLPPGGGRCGRATHHRRRPHGLVRRLHRRLGRRLQPRLRGLRRGANR